jgi:hypothetical protein
MEKIYMLEWAGNGQLGKYAYLSKEKAEKLANNGNAELSRFRKFICGLTGIDAKWIVKEIPIIE